MWHVLQILGVAVVLLQYYTTNPSCMHIWTLLLHWLHLAPVPTPFQYCFFAESVSLDCDLQGETIALKEAETSCRTRSPRWTNKP